MSLLDAINDAWGWIGVRAVDIVGRNAFGNVIFTDPNGAYWRILPEDADCVKVADSKAAFQKLTVDPEFSIDWEMARLVRLAREELGPLQPDYCYYLVIPSALGGAYDPGNMGTAPIREVILYAGDTARQIKNLPQGAKVKLKVVD